MSTVGGLTMGARPWQEYKANMAEMVQWVQAHCPATKIILITPPPVDEVNAHTACRP